MLMKSLVLGVLFSVGIFAVKSGIGVSYCVAGVERKRDKVCSLMLFALTYFVVFIAAAFVLKEVDPVRHLPVIQQFMQSGMIIHVIIAGLMIGWGLILLKQNKRSLSKSRGWVMLAMPCPVCATVIVLSAAVFVSYFPEHPIRVLLLFYLAFMVINLITMGLVHIFQKTSDIHPDAFLGGAMLLMAAYFLLSATVMPQFSDLDKVYRMACYRTDTKSMDVACIVNVMLLAFTAFTVGYGFTFKKIRSYK